MDKDKQIISLERMLKLKTDDWLEVCKEYDELKIEVENLNMSLQCATVEMQKAEDKILNKELVEAMETIRKTPDWPHNCYPSQVDRCWCVAVKRHIKGLKVEVRDLKSQIEHPNLGYKPRLSNLCSYLTEIEVKLREAEKEISLLRTRSDELAEAGKHGNKYNLELSSKLTQAVTVLKELKHLNHHTIEEEIWRIDTVLEGIERKP